jgi:hypothetical protein
LRLARGECDSSCRLADQRREWTRQPVLRAGCLTRRIALPFSAASDHTMWRALFLAVGITMCILGAECLVVEKFVMGAEGPPTEQAPATIFGAPPTPLGVASRDIEPAEWAPWSLLSAGAVIILYAVTLNRQG